MLCIDNWDQYDGVMHPEPPSWIKQKFHSLKDKFTGAEAAELQKRSRAAVKMLLPPLHEFLLGQSDTGLGQDVVKKIDQVCSCVQHQLYDDDYQKPDSSKLTEVRTTNHLNFYRLCHRTKPPRV